MSEIIVPRSEINQTRYFLRVHYSEGTVDIHLPEDPFEMNCAYAAKQIIGSGVYDPAYGPKKDGKRFYPPSSIVFVELVAEV